MAKRILVEMGAPVGSVCADVAELEATIARQRQYLDMLEVELAKAKGRQKGVA